MKARGKDSSARMAIPVAPVAASAELVVQNGRHAGARKPLTSQVTLIGRAAGCDIRLQMEGVAEHHCLVAHTPAGLVVRDLGSDGGTLVNGERIQATLLQEGDRLTVGPLQFRLQGFIQPTAAADTTPAESKPAHEDAFRVQVAAVAAQQASLEEEELRLSQRQQALRQQEEQLAAHLEDKRRKLVVLSDRTQAERQALEKERTAYETFLSKINGDFSEAQRELVENQRKVEAERHRLAEFNQRLKQRWRRHWQAERAKMAAYKSELAAEARLLQQEAAKVHML